ncbi:ankyrin repeat domain-containing protein [Spiroplasma endosymbiont of Nebria brevicollis]|uniref:ankyrin repeat domain-containing protein n=1 Tax=Spiroplasma endosymbiont of Nebria brevicollis TaxID=3066284 RepID=UPI00313D82A1
MLIIEWLKKIWNERKRNKLLYSAAENGNLEEVKKLITAGADVNYKSTSSISISNRAPSTAFFDFSVKQTVK